MVHGPVKPDMRDLTLIDTIYLAVLLLLSLVLPLLMSFHGPREAVAGKRCLRIVWTGQAIGVLAGLAILVSAPTAAYAVAIGLASCICCAHGLLGQFRVGVVVHQKAWRRRDK